MKIANSRKWWFCSVFFFMMLPLLAHSQLSVITRACGPDEEKFTVSEAAAKGQITPLAKNLSRIVVFPEAISVVAGCRYTTRIGIDGQWVGATCPGSYLSYDVHPGEHHVCADLQKKNQNDVALYQLTAEAGRVYYFRAEIIDFNRYGVNTAMHLEPVNEDEGQLLLQLRAKSTSKSK